MTCIYDVRWSGEHGIGRFSREIAARLNIVEYKESGQPMSPADPFKLSLTLRKFPANSWFFSPGYNSPILPVIPYVLTIHDLNHIDRHENSSSLKRIYYKTVLRHLCRNARAILTVSEFSKERVVDWSGVSACKVFNVGNGVSEVFTPAGKKYNPGYEYILCVSNRKGHKNEMGVLRSFAKAKLPSQVHLDKSLLHLFQNSKSS